MKTFDSLFAELSEKAAARPADSGTVAELDAGIHAIGKKIVEEAAEVWMAAEFQSHAFLLQAQDLRRELPRPLPVGGHDARPVPRAEARRRDT